MATVLPRWDKVSSLISDVIQDEAFAERIRSADREEQLEILYSYGLTDHEIVQIITLDLQKFGSPDKLARRGFWY
jgi:hypothetical protein